MRNMHIMYRVMLPLSFAGQVRSMPVFVSAVSVCDVSVSVYDVCDTVYQC